MWVLEQATNKIFCTNFYTLKAVNKEKHAKISNDFVVIVIQFSGRVDAGNENNIIDIDF